MSSEIFLRTELLLGRGYYKNLANKTVAVFGLGGVGGYAVEALARSGIGNLILVDNDVIDETNINRHVLALHSTIGMFKTSLFEKRVADINPECKVYSFNEFVLPEMQIFKDIFSSFDIDYVLDAVDTIRLKVGLATFCEKKNISIVSAMGCGNRVEANFRFADIYKTSGCPLCRVMRKSLRDCQVEKLDVLYSPDSPDMHHNPPASVPWVPAIAGLMLAGRIVMSLI
ncbi:MAG: tRNA threonylcarbamoyladenosine dehydratase [Treponema sp.]|nr:MAG: tRNA threonylcarbamoyladenosine dehydratase [Treponema sp.]